MVDHELFATSLKEYLVKYEEIIYAIKKTMVDHELFATPLNEYLVKGERLLLFLLMRCQKSGRSRGNNIAA